MSETIDDVVIVGGGDVGLLTALGIQKLNSGVEVSVVDDFEQPLPEVGKSTYREIRKILHGTLEIEEPAFIAEVKPIWKASVYFRDWCGYPPFHYPFDSPDRYPAKDTPDAFEHYYHEYSDLYNNPDHRTRGEQIVEQGVSPWYYGPSGDLDCYDEVAYHLDTQRFNSFLRGTCTTRGISLVDDRVIGVETSGAYIDGVHGENGHYEGDLYIDATGFNRVLRGEQDAGFREFDFPLDSALNLGIERSLADVVPATVVETGDNGWFWSIDTYGVRDLGYVYASEYVDEGTARDAFFEYVRDASPGTPSESTVSESKLRTYEFSSGYFERAWVENCLAIGNAGGFVEPLQSTALTANASLAVRFANLLSSHGRLADDGLREAYNIFARRTWESIRDFISVHYLYSAGETPFWRAMNDLEVSSRVESMINGFDQYGYDWTADTSDMATRVLLRIFLEPDFYTLIRNMNGTSELYETNDFEVSETIKRENDQRYEQVEAYVAQNHLTAEELYRGILEL